VSLKLSGALNYKPYLVNRYHKNPQNDMGLYKVVEGDHIAFRYQVIQECGRGAFG
jgi:hypothetical protein